MDCLVCGLNLAGLGASLAIVPNEELRIKFALTAQGIVPHVNILAFVAATAAYSDGQNWLSKGAAGKSAGPHGVCAGRSLALLPFAGYNFTQAVRVKLDGDCSIGDSQRRVR